MTGSHAAAFARELGLRHRWGFAVVAAYVVALAALKAAEAATGARVVPDTGGGFALGVMIPATGALYWFLAIFSFGLSGDLTGRGSIYPPRLFTLPVSSAALAGWPVLYGAVAVGMLWLAVRLLAPWPAVMPAGGLVLWPGLLAMGVLAWTQALAWMPYPVRGMRIAVTVAVLSAASIGGVIALEYGLPEPLLVALLAPQPALAFLAARYAVARARRGDVPDLGMALEAVAGPIGRLLSRLGGWLGAGLGRAPGRRPTPARAQLWLEWRRHGWSLPAQVAIVVPLELALLGLARGAPRLTLTILVLVAVTPPVLASFAAVAARRAGASPGGGDEDHGVSPFIATRPLSSAALVAAKLKAAALSTAVAWVLVLVLVPAGLALSGTWAPLAERAARLAEVAGASRAVVVGLLVLAGLVVTTWRQMVQSLYIGLTGRARLVRASALLTLFLVAVAWPVLEWLWTAPGSHARLWAALHWALAILVPARMLAGSWIAHRLHRDRLLDDIALVAAAASWALTVLALYVLLVWLVATPIVPRYLLAGLAILAVPLVRLGAAPLALDWNRHR